MGKRYLHKNVLIVLTFDIILIGLAWYFSHLLIFNFSIPNDAEFVTFATIPLVIIIKILIFNFFKLYQGMWRYTSLTDLLNILKGTSVGCIAVFLTTLFIYNTADFSHSVFVIDWCLTFLMISGCRVAIRLFFWLSPNQTQTPFEGLGLLPSIFVHRGKGKRLMIIGAGDCGEKITREIHDNPHLGYNIVGFIDDMPAKAKLFIHGIPVLGRTRDLKFLTEKLEIEELLIAIPSATYSQMRTIVAACEGSGIPYKTVPGMGELINGTVTVKSIREVDYNDLIGRDQVRLDQASIGGYLKDSSVLVTGAGGSIGSELCRQICRFSPRQIILFERAESPLYEIELELKGNSPYIAIDPVLADIRDTNQVLCIFEAYKPDVVFHAAAYKHVPMMEIQPWQAIKNNILGTRNILAACGKFSVGRFVFVSTDKAVRPTNVMGASKRVSELLVHCQNGSCAEGGRYMAVRFGNVVGSVGSVVPYFKKQIEKGGPVTVTHPEVTRYFMTIPEASQLILQAGAMGRGGETFILDMGTPIKIVDMARDLIRLSGYEPDVDIKIEYIGLRPGEKLYEELITEGEGIEPTGHKKIMVLKGKPCDQAKLDSQINELDRLADIQDSDGIRKKLREILPEFNMENGREISGRGKQAEGGKFSLCFPDRRKDKRLRPINGSVIIPDIKPLRSCKIRDIGRGGLSFYYEGTDDMTKGYAGLAISMADSGFSLEEIPCRIVSHYRASATCSPDTNKPHRFSVQFGELTQHQKDQLEYFIENYTASEKVSSS
ncbi:Polysaccharide biosynthesis protein CapD [uncultured Desulfobacterium sp.]|uniref:Polysaccharide biosynthesis protein CapD n=1 Tax=uncultured Desulfobacterium sp. TaxID=201089 RepID=A0A445MT77_9BACT|nr:Polysaccharide biosynthesis protein CapD [uncultured Desulfobacterium sp.]